MKYDDIKPRRHEILRQIALLNEELKALDAPLVPLMARQYAERGWADPEAQARMDLAKMHKKHDPKF